MFVHILGIYFPSTSPVTLSQHSQEFDPSISLLHAIIRRLARCRRQHSYLLGVWDPSHVPPIIEIIALAIVGDYQRLDGHCSTGCEPINWEGGHLQTGCGKCSRYRCYHMGNIGDVSLLQIYVIGLKDLSRLA